MQLSFLGLRPLSRRLAVPFSGQQRGKGLKARHILAQAEGLGWPMEKDGKALKARHIPASTYGKRPFFTVKPQKLQFCLQPTPHQSLTQKK